MRVLCLTSRLPYPPDRGDRLRAFHLIEHLSREHELWLLSFVASEEERRRAEELRRYCRQVHTVLMTPIRSAVTVAFNAWRREPLQALYYRSREMQRLVGEVLHTARFDVVYVHLFRMVPYVANRPGLYRIVDLTDVISREIRRSLPYRGVFSRLIYAVEAPRIQRYERWVAQNFEEVWLISGADRRVLAAACPGANLQVVPNGVDQERFYPTGQPCEPNSLIFVGHLRVFHNIDAAIHLVQEVLPRVRQEIPDCTLKIVGADPHPRVRRLADDPAVTVTGFVPNLNEHLNRSAVFVAPLRFAAGVQNKVLEAMATARPVVTTSVVNEGIGATPGRELLVADDPETMARQIVTLLRDEPLRQSLGREGLEFVRRSFSWDHALKRMRVIGNRLLVGRVARAGPSSRARDGP